MRLLDYEALKDKGVNFSRVHIWRLIKDGRFPKPIKLGGGSRNAWVESEIDDFIAAKMAQRDAGAA